MSLRVFISHSSRSAFACRVRDGLSTALKAQGHAVLLDRERLEPGDGWRAKLHRWLATCQAGVILFSRDAVGTGARPGSEWVLKEATILTWRLALNPSLLVVPALLGDVTPEETRLNGFRPLALDELQFARLESTEETDANAAALVQRIAARFEGAAPAPDADPALEDWLRRVRVCLKKVDPEDLDAAARSAGIAPADWSDAGDERCSTLAWHVLCSGLRKVIPALHKLRSSMPSDQLARFADLVLPTWVPEEVARGLLPVTKEAEPRRFAAINTQYARLAEHYVQRATCCAPEVAVVRATGVTGEEVESEALASLDRAFRRSLNIAASRPPAYVRTACERQRQPFFALVGNGALRRDVLAEVRARYPRVTFVLVSGPEFPDASALGLPHLECIRPPLDPGTEMDADLTISDAQTALGLSPPEEEEEAHGSR